MLKSLIYKIEGLIAEMLGEGAIALYNSKASRQRWANTFGAECELSRQKLLHELLGAKHEPAVFRYVHYHQAHFIRLSDLVSASLVHLTDGETEKAQLFNIILAELEKLITFLRTSFYNYFDADQKLSVYSSVNDLPGINTLWENLDRAAKNNERPLQQIILNWLCGIKNDLIYHNCTYRQAEQAHLIFRMVEEMVYLRGMADDILALSLFRENFNLTASSAGSRKT